MHWFKIVTAGHGDTLEGQMMKEEFFRLKSDIEQLRLSAMHGGPASVLPRWQGEIRHRILLLPPTDRVERMSMYELGELRKQVDAIKGHIDKYGRRRFEEILGADSP